MPPRVLKRKDGPTAQKKTGTKASRKSLKPVSSTPLKAKPEAVMKADSKPSPTVEAPKAEEKVVPFRDLNELPVEASTPLKAEPEALMKADSKPSPTVEAPKAEEKVVPFQDLKELPVEAEPEKEMPVEDANKLEDKGSTMDADKPSPKAGVEGVRGKDLENKETDAVMHEAQDYEDREHQDEPTENNIVMGEHSHGDEVAEETRCREEGDEGDDQRELEMPAMVKERIKQKEFEVFVGGLDWDADEEDLKKAFSAVGEVVEIRMARNPKTRKNKGIGFVRFATVEQAKKAVAELKNPRVRGKQCRVTQNQDNETLYVRNICKSWRKEDLHKKLTEYGIDNIEEITLTENLQQEGTNKGFAFLVFPTHLEATNAFKRLQKRDVFFGIDFRAKVEFAKCGIEPDEEVMSQVKSIFVDGLPPSWDEKQVQDKFQKYGEIERVQLARNMATKRKDFGFIHFATREAALACIEEVNKNELSKEDNKVTMKAILQKPPQKGQSYGFRSAYGGSSRVPWVRGVGDSRFGVHEGRHFLDERRQPFGRTYDRRTPGVRSDYRRNYREDRATSSARSIGTVTRQSSYMDAYGHHRAGYSESIPPRRPDRYSDRMNGMAAYNDEAIRDYIGVSGSNRPYSEVDNDLSYPGRHSRSRLDYDAGAVHSRYGGVSRVGQDPQVGYGAGSRDGGIYDAGAADSRYGGVSSLGQDLQVGYGGVSRVGQAPLVGYGPAREYAGVSGSKRPYSDVDYDLPYPARHSRSRLDYDAGAGVSWVGQDPEVGYGAGSSGSRAGGIYSSDNLHSVNDVEGGAYPSVLNRNATGGYGRGRRGSASFY